MKKLESTMARLLDGMADFGAPPTEQLTPNGARNLPTLEYAAREFEARHGGSRLALLSEPIPERVGRIAHEVIQGPTGEPLLLRIYTPVGGDAPHPVVVFFHGGGFVLGDLNGADTVCRGLCNAAAAIVVSVAYRLAPEAPFPAAVDDAWAAYHWVLLHSFQFGGDPVRVAVAGESAGGNLAAVVCLRARDEGVQMPEHQLLIYPLTDWSLAQPSYTENAEARPLTAARMAWFKRHYLRNPAEAADWRASPLRAASHAGLPPATVITAENDPLRDEGREYAEALRAGGVPVGYHHFDGVPHVFLSALGLVPQADEAMRVAGRELKRSFRRGDRQGG